MEWKLFTSVALYLTLLFISCPSWAAHPLITDDNGTQGKGKFQLELNGRHDWDKVETQGSLACFSGSDLGSHQGFEACRQCRHGTQSR